MGAKLCVIMKEDSSSDEGEVNGHDRHEAWVSRHGGGHQVEGHEPETTLDWRREVAQSSYSLRIKTLVHLLSCEE